MEWILHLNVEMLNLSGKNSGPNSFERILVYLYIYIIQVAVSVVEAQGTVRGAEDPMCTKREVQNL